MIRRWKKRAAQGNANAALRRASAALGSRLARARALRMWSALRLAKQQSEIAKLHQVAQWHLQTLLGATSDVGEKHDPVLAIRQLVKKWSNALLMRVWNAWKLFVYEQRDATVPQMESAVKRWTNGELTKAWETWGELCSQRASAARVLERWRLRAAHAAWGTWREMAAYRRAAQALFADARMLPGAEMLKRWRHFGKVTARLNDAFEQARKLMALTHLRVGFMCFKRVFAAENATGAVTSVASAFLRDVRLKMVWQSWTKLSRERAANMLGIRAAVGRWHHQALAFCFTRLLDFATNRASIFRAVGALFKAGLHKAMLTWRAFAEDARAARKRLKSGLKKLANSDMTYALMRISATADKRRRLQELRRIASEFAAPRKVLRRVMESWSGRGALRRGGLKIAQQMMAGMLLKGWRSWRAQSEAFGAAKRVAQRLMNRDLLKFWNGWRETAERLSASLAAMSKVATLISNRQISSSFRSWIEYGEEARSTHNAALGVVARLVNGKLAAGWGSWCAMYEQNLKLRTAFASILNVAVKWALAEWKVAAFERRDQIAAMYKAAHRIRQAGLGKAFAQWAHNAFMLADKQRRVQGLMSEFGARLVSEHLASALFQWKRWSEGCRDATRILELSAESMIPTMAPFRHWKEIALEGARSRRALLTAAAAWSGGLRGRWIAWLDYYEIRKAKGRSVKKVMDLWQSRDLAKMERAFLRLASAMEHMLMLRRMVGRWQNQAMSNGFRAWMVAYAFARAGALLRHSALQTVAGRGFTRFKEAYHACLVRRQAGRFQAAAKQVLFNDLGAAFATIRKRAAEKLCSTVWRKRAKEHRFATALFKLHARCADSAASDAMGILAERNARRVAFNRFFASYRDLSRPGGPWQLRTVADACAVAYKTRKGLARWQQHCFRVLCLACAVQHARIRTARLALHGWTHAVRVAIERRAEHRRQLEAKAEARLLERVIKAWKDAARLKLLSMPSHLYSLATAWGAGAAHWRLVELREAERHAAQAMAHHAAAMERARVDSQRVQLELVRASADHEINRLRAHEIGGAGGAGYPPTVAPVQQPPMVPVPPVVSLPPYAAPTPYGHAGLAQYLAASAPPTANLNALADAILTESNANTANAAAGAAASARTASAALAEASALARMRAELASRNAATHAQSQSAAKLSRTLADYGFAGGLPPAPYAMGVPLPVPLGAHASRYSPYVSQSYAAAPPSARAPAGCGGRPASAGPSVAASERGERTGGPGRMLDRLGELAPDALSGLAALGNEYIDEVGPVGR